MSGERALHRDLESALAEVYGVAECITFVSGHATNVTSIGYLFGPKDLIIHDGFFEFHNVFFGPGTRNELKETYMAAKQQGRVIWTLEEEPAPQTKPTGCSLMRSKSKWCCAPIEHDYCPVYWSTNR